MSQFYAVTFKQARDHLSHLGYTARAIAILSELDIPLLSGFIITPDAFTDFIHHQNLANAIKVKITHSPENDPKELERTARHIRKLIKHHPINNNLLKTLRRLYKRHLQSDWFTFTQSHQNSQVRFSHEHDRIHKGQAVFFDELRTLWADYFTPQTLRKLKSTPYFLPPAVIVREWRTPEFSGTVITRHTKKNTIQITAVYGIHHHLVDHITPRLPDIYQVTLRPTVIINKQIIAQPEYDSINRFGQLTKKNTSPAVSVAKLTDRQILELAKWGSLIQNHFLSPQEILWCLQDRLWIISTRELQQLSEIDPPVSKPPPNHLTGNLEVITKGYPAGAGVVSAPARVVTTPKSFGSVKSGEIIVTSQASRELFLVLKKVVGIVTATGGPTSHAGILARELGIPAVTGAKSVLNRVKTGQVITVDGQTGRIFKGGITNYQTLPLTTHSPTSRRSSIPEKTATKLLLNISGSAAAARWSSLLNAGIGALRGDIILAEFGYHPKHVLNQKDRFQQFLSQTIIDISRHVPNAPIYYHPVDLTSSQFAMLVGGKIYEPIEPNPLLGFKGSLRTLIDPSLFELECTVLNQLRQKHGLKQLHLVLPQVRTASELISIKRLAASHKLMRNTSLEIWASITTPVNVFQLQEFAKIGIDGLFLNLNHLGTYAGAIDINNQEVNLHFNPLEPGFISLLQYFLEATRTYKLNLIAYGLALTKYPDLINILINGGVTALSIDALTYANVKHEVVHAEASQITNKSL